MQIQDAIFSGLINAYKQHDKWQRRGDKLRRGKIGKLKNKFIRINNSTIVRKDRSHITQYNLGGSLWQQKPFL